MTQSDQSIGIIGGTGFYDIPGISWEEEKHVTTPFGDPSDVFRIGRSGDKRIVFLPRHGKEHTIIPSHINYQANIYGMKSLGVCQLLSTSAVGSFREDLPPQEMIIVDQFVDRTKDGDRHTFFGEHGVVAHIGFSHPVCPHLTATIAEKGQGVTDKIHQGGTYLNIEGPAFSTRAESVLYKRWGMDVIGMTSLVEAKLAREAEICFATIAIVTDFDSWHQDMEVVSTTSVLENFKKAVKLARQVLAETLTALTPPENCGCPQALDEALLTNPAALSDDAKEHYGVLLQRVQKR